MEGGGAHNSPRYGMDFHMDSNLPTPYVSAPSSPCRSSSFNGTPHFYSVPVSPMDGLPNVSSRWEFDSPAPKSSDSNLDDFEFETSKRFESPPCRQHRRKETWEMIRQARKQPQKQPPPQPQPQQHEQKVGDAPIMSFADELFCNGRLRPLKLPPRLHHGSNPSSCVSSPKSPGGSISSRRFHGHSFRYKDFDPFTAALQEIRKEDMWMYPQSPPHRRARSLSPLNSLSWACGRQCGPLLHDKGMSPLEPAWQVKVVSRGPAQTKTYSTVTPTQTNPYSPVRPAQTKTSSPVGPTEPAWKVELVPIGPNDPNIEPPVGPTRQSAFPGPRASDGGPPGKFTRRWRSIIKWSKRKMTRDRLLRSASDRWAHTKDKLRDQTAGIRNREENRSMGFRPIDEDHYNENEDVQQDMRKKSITPYHPSGLFLCFGFRSKGMKYKK